MTGAGMRLRAGGRVLEMLVRAQYYGSLRLLIGQSEEEFQVSGETLKLADLIGLLELRHGSRVIPECYYHWVNVVRAGGESLEVQPVAKAASVLLYDGDIVKFISPISGGDRKF